MEKPVGMVMHMMDGEPERPPRMRADETRLWHLLKAIGDADVYLDDVSTPPDKAYMGDPHWFFRHKAMKFAAKMMNYAPTLSNWRNPAGKRFDDVRLFHANEAGLGNATSDSSGLIEIDFHLALLLDDAERFNSDDLQMARKAVRSIRAHADTIAEAEEFAKIGSAFAMIEFTQAEANAYLDGFAMDDRQRQAFVRDVIMQVATFDAPMCATVTLAFASLRSAIDLPPGPPRPNEVAEHLWHWDFHALFALPATARLSAALGSIDDLEALIDAEIARAEAERESWFGAQRAAPAREGDAPARIGAPVHKNAPALTAGPASALRAGERDAALLESLRAAPGASLRDLAQRAGLASTGDVSRRLDRLQREGAATKENGRWRAA